MSLQLLHNASSPHAVPAVRQIAHSIVEASQDDWSNAGTLAYVHCPLHVQRVLGVMHCLGCFFGYGSVNPQLVTLTGIPTLLSCPLQDCNH